MKTKRNSQSMVTRRTVFGFFWAVAHFVDEFRQPTLIQPDSFEGVMHLMVFALAVALLYKPSSDFRLAALAIANVILIFSEMPIMPNHNMIFFMADTAILLTIGWSQLAKSNEFWFAKAEPFLRLALFFTYGSATIAKLNTGWFDTSLSCACSMPANEFSFLPFEVPWQTFWFMPWMIFLAEAAIWTLPLFKATRFIGLPLAAVFHFSLSLTPASQGLGFSYLLFALLILYLPDSGMNDIDRFGRSLMRWVKEKNLLPLLAYGFLIVSALFGYAAFFSEQRELLAVLRYGPALVGLGLWAGSIAFLAIIHRREKQIDNPIGVANPLQLALALLIIANSISPYLGLKTYATMTMYSNLQMETGKANHLLIPRLSGQTLADDLVDVVSTSNARVAAWASNDFQVTWHELRREMSKTPQLPISYIRDGEIFEYEYAAENLELVSIDPVLHKITGFRPSGRSPYCVW